jgi:hypothetical protein
MAIAGCEQCGRVESVPHPDPRLGGRFKACPDCDADLRWMRIAEAVSLYRKRSIAVRFRSRDARRAAPSNGGTATADTQELEVIRQ